MEAASRAERIQLEAEKSALEKTIKINAEIIEKLEEKVAVQLGKDTVILQEIRKAKEVGELVGEPALAQVTKSKGAGC